MQLLLAPAGQGKTEHVIQQIQKTRETEPLAQIWVILPNQEQVRAFQRRLAGHKGTVRGTLGVNLFTFYRVYGEILARRGRPVPRLPDPVQYRLLRLVVDSLCEQDKLAYYLPLRDKPGFLKLLRGLFLELKRAFVEPEVFSQALAAKPPQLSELATMFALYQQWLKDTNWADAEGQGWLAFIAMQEMSSLGSDIDLLVVDGFDEFNPTQLAVLGLLAQRAGETLLTLTGQSADASKTRDAHIRFERARNELITQCPGLEITPVLLPARKREGDIAHIEKGLFRPEAGKQETDGSIKLLEARNRAGEVKAALRFLKQHIVKHNLQPHEVAVLARDLGPYHPFLLETASEFGLPLYFTGGEDLISNPVIAALLNLLSLPIHDWPQRDVLQAWRSPYFDWSKHLTAGDEIYQTMEMASTRLARVVREARIMSGLEQWRDALILLVEAPDQEIDKWEEVGIEGSISNSEAGVLSGMFEAFVSLLRPADPATLEDHIRFVDNLIGDDPRLQPAGATQEDTETNTRSLNVVGLALEKGETADRDEAALQAFKDVLRGLLLADTITATVTSSPSNEPISYSRFVSELRGAVEAATYRLPYPKEGAILAASVIQARGLSFRAAALMGLAEGEFPHREREDPLLRDEERLQLRANKVHLHPRVRGEEGTLFYEAMTRASEHLLLTRPYLTEDGQPWEPSPYWTEIGRLLAVKPHHQFDSIETSQPASAVELLAALGSNMAAREALPPEIVAEALVAEWQHLRHAAGIVAARLAKATQGPYEGDLSSISQRLQGHFREKHVWSSSRLEAYATCPLSFYMGSGLDLEPRLQPEEGYDILIRGSIYHEVLEKIFSKASDLADTSQETLLALLPDIAKEVLDDAPEKYGFRPTALWSFQREALAQTLKQTLVGLAEAAGDFVPLGLELAFGLKDKPPLHIEMEEGTLYLRGYIDRVDHNADGKLRIIDYKSGSTPIRPDDLDQGKRIQLPLYALAAEKALDLGEVSEGFYWHIGTAAASRLTLRDYPGGVPAALETAAHHALSHVQGIRAGRYQPKPPPGGCRDSCPAIGFCWRARQTAFRR